MAPSFELRPAAKADLAFCWPIYRDAVQPLTANWNEAEHQRLVEKAVGHAGTSILYSDKADKGWVEVSENHGSVELKQLFILADARNNGLGTSFLNWMKERADRKRKDLLLEVLANSPARGLCERLGFKAVTTADNKVTMRYQRQAGILTDDFIDRFAIVGPPDRCIGRLKSLAKLGLDKVAISGGMRGAPEEHIPLGKELVVKEVIPAMRE